jgi:aryl-alcohol dehydrogenase-like predicted oxidoreductase
VRVIRYHLAMNTRRIGPFTVNEIGFGCMNLSHAYASPPPADQAAKVLLTALDLGVNFFDTAALYGFGANESLVGNVLKSHCSRIVLASKCGMTGVDGKRVIDGRAETIKRTCDESLQRLQTDVIDIYYLHRWDKKVPIEESVGAMADLVEAGKIKAVGLSEVSAATLRKAHAVHPIAAVQSEYSLWTREPEIAVLDVCKELGIAFVAFSPLGRGFLTGVIGDANGMEPKDIRRGMPRFYPENFAKNQSLLNEYSMLAKRAGCTPGQFALAWLLAKSKDIIPIPGTTSLSHLRENVAAAQVELDATLIAAAERLINQHTVIGARYNDATQQEIDTEMF